jgi:hypothetical protein
MKAPWLAALVVFPLAAREPLAQRIVHTDPRNTGLRRRCMEEQANWISWRCWTLTVWIPTCFSCIAA